MKMKKKETKVSRWGRQILSIQDDSNLENAKRQMKVSCPYCKHKISFYAYERAEKKLCDYCKRYVFKDKRKEFEYRLKEQIRRKEI